jgi:hypothetical protein
VAATEFAAQILSIALTAIGTTLLVREVDKAHRVEAMSHETDAEKELLALYQTDLREFWIRAAMRSANYDRATADQMATDLGEDAIRAGVAEYSELYERSLPAGLQRWYELTVPAVLKRRHRDLWAGFWFLIAGLGLQLAIAAGHFVGYW